MANVIQIADARQGYVDLVRWVEREGLLIAPRGLTTREVTSATVSIADAYNTLPVGVGRGINTGIAAVEACQLLASESRPGLVIKIGPQFSNYAEDNGEFHGAYGVRTEGQYAAVVERLKDDPSSRQAVVTIWDPELDLMTQGKRDYPCTILHQFLIRNDALHLLVYMRSNDVWKGCGYDFYQFTRVQIAMASVLGVDVGPYEHHAGSLHLYSTDYAATQRLVYPEVDDGYVPPPAFTDGSWEGIQGQAKLALDAVEDDELYGELTEEQHPAVLWHAKAMRDAIVRNAAT